MSLPGILVSLDHCRNGLEEDAGVEGKRLPTGLFEFSLLFIVHRSKLDAIKACPFKPSPWLANSIQK
jgi:hypothetical protein